MSFKLDDSYIDVAARIVEFRTKHPDGSLQQVSVEFMVCDGQGGWVYTAAAYRSPDDTRPGHGTAWEPFPGKTPYTKDSELQNAETAAWGRAIVAVLAADTKKGVASADEVRHRQPEERPDPLRDVKHTVWVLANKDRQVIDDALASLDPPVTANTALLTDWQEVEKLLGGPQ